MSKVVQKRTKGRAGLKMGKVTHVRDISKCEAVQIKARVVLRKFWWSKFWWAPSITLDNKKDVLTYF